MLATIAPRQAALAGFWFGSRLIGVSVAIGVERREMRMRDGDGQFPTTARRMPGGCADSLFQSLVTGSAMKLASLGAWYTRWVAFT
jgi:hypothetical protein